MQNKIGLIGFGVIGKYLYDRISEAASMEVGFVHDAEPDVTASLPRSLVAEDLEAMKDREVEMVVESAHPDAVRDFGLPLLQKSDLLILSLTSLADDSYRREISECAQRAGKRIFIPHGAIIGLDGIFDGRNVIEHVSVTTSKRPKSLGMDDAEINEPMVVYNGPTRGACERFPRNVNIHAAIALAGLGFDNTHSKIVADPRTETMGHVIEVSGRGLYWKIEVESRIAGDVTGAYTPESIYKTVERLCLRNAGLNLA